MDETAAEDSAAVSAAHLWLAEADGRGSWRSTSSCGSASLGSVADSAAGNEYLFPRTSYLINAVQTALQSESKQRAMLHTAPGTKGTKPYPSGVNRNRLMLQAYAPARSVWRALTSGRNRLTAQRRWWYAY